MEKKKNKTFLCLFTVKEDPNLEASAGDSLLMLVFIVFNDARDSNLRRPEEPPPPSLL